ncbi:hypothetical protein E4U43_006721 [Claviceps pusilla]|uniref:Uncharacterized protein n=1 Tax=Claviceps pusilla TaxID=123648 RepID=A0A9P7N324_9HYPO|nr:hypothetical protein E4U43_006721 [Claviceps pusilla]
MARAADLARQEARPDDDASATDTDADARDQAGLDDADADADGTTALLDPEDAAAVMSDDDVSLWEAQGRLESGNAQWGAAYNDGGPSKYGKVETLDNRKLEKMTIPDTTAK